MESGLKSFVVDPAEHIGLVHCLVNKWVGKYKNFSDYDDMVSEGTIGLIKAARSFRPELGNQFSTYACVAIGRHISRWYVCEHVSTPLRRSLGPGGRPLLADPQLMGELDAAAPIAAYRERDSVSHIIDAADDDMDRQILELLARGFGNGNIGRVLGISRQKIRDRILLMQDRIRQRAAPSIEPIETQTNCDSLSSAEHHSPEHDQL